MKIEAAKSIMLDRELYSYGPEALGARRLLRSILQHGVDRIEMTATQGVGSEFHRQGTMLEELYLEILRLKPGDHVKSELQASAESLAKDLMQSRWMINQALNSTIQAPLLAILVFWLSCVFLNLGLLASHHASVVASLFLAALSMTGAIYLTLAFDRPYQGLIRISSAPLKLALLQFMPM